MRRIAKYNKEQKLKKIDNKIKAKEEKLEAIEDKLQDRDKRWEKVKDFISEIYEISVDDDYDDYEDWED